MIRVTYNVTLGLVCLMIAFLLTACSPSMVHQKAPETPAAAVQQVLDEVNTAVAAAAPTLKQAYVDGAITWEQFLKARTLLVDVSTHADQADDFLKGGKLLDAKSQLELAQKALVEVQKYLIARKGDPNAESKL